MTNSLDDPAVTTHVVLLHPPFSLSNLRLEPLAHLFHLAVVGPPLLNFGTSSCDKIAASKRKGLWVGGPVPLGYRCLNKKLEIVPEEAEAVRTIFSLYLALGSMGALLAELDRRGVRTKVNGRRDGQKRGRIRFGVGPLA